MPQLLKPKDIKALDAIETLIRRRKPEEALAESLAFTRNRPQLIEGWEQLSEIAHMVGNDYYLWNAMRQLCQLDPHEENYRYNFCVLSLRLGFAFLARQSVDIYLKRFPDGVSIKQINEMKRSLDSSIQYLIDNGEIPADYKVDDMALFEMGNLLTSHGEYIEGRKFSLQAAKKMPTNPSPLNNVSLSYLVEGNLIKALQTTDEVLAAHPDNIFAQGSKIQILVRLGRADDAHSLLDELREVTPVNHDHWLKIMEAAAYAHKHQMVIDIYERALRHFKQDKLSLVPLMHHLAGTAYMFMGETHKANRAWDKVLKVDRFNNLTLENKHQFRSHGPWYLPLSNWVPRSWLQAIATVLERTVKRSEEVQRREIDRLIAKTPGLEATATLLLERGDPEGLDFALHLAQYHPLPGLVEFALGRRGTDEKRMQAAQIAVKHGLLSRGEPVTLIVQGEPREVMLTAFEVYTEPDKSNNPLPQAAQARLQSAHEALLAEDYETVLQEAEKGLAIAPGSTSLLNHKANALYMLNRRDEADAINRQLAADNPDYLFARVAMAQICIQEGRLDEADEWLRPLLTRQRLHISEFRGLAKIYIQYWRAKGEIAGTKYWMQMLSEVDPDSVPDDWQEMMAMMDTLEMIKGLSSKKKNQ